MVKGILRHQPFYGLQSSLRELWIVGQSVAESNGRTPQSVEGIEQLECIAYCGINCPAVPIRIRSGSAKSQPMGQIQINGIRPFLPTAKESGLDFGIFILSHHFIGNPDVLGYPVLGHRLSVNFVAILSINLTSYVAVYQSLSQTYCQRTIEAFLLNSPVSHYYCRSSDYCIGYFSRPFV